MTEGRQLVDITSMLGCRLRLHEFDHEGKSCLRLSLDVDSRHAEVLLDSFNALELVEGLEAWAV
jgi:hypothetical protein